MYFSSSFGPDSYRDRRGRRIDEVPNSTNAWPLAVMLFSHRTIYVMQHKKSLLSLALISWIIIEGCKEQPITISQDQVEAVFSPGRTMRLFWDSTSQPVNAGRTGGPNVYDFSSLPFVMYDSSEMFSVSQIPKLALRYPSNAVAAKEEGGTVYPVFSFSNNKFYREGRGRISSDTTEWYQHFVPAAEWLRFPVAFNTQFSTTNTAIVDTTYVNSIPTNTSSDTSSHATTYVDGFGTLLLPGGLAFECLRIRREESFPKTSKLFQFWTREGPVILIESDNSQPDTGIIKREYVIYFSPQARNQKTND